MMLRKLARGSVNALRVVADHHNVLVGIGQQVQNLGWILLVSWYSSTMT